jgi:hypothetical protein
MKRILHAVLVTVALTSACWLQGCNQSPQTPPSPTSITGRWRLQTIAGRAPGAFNIDQYEAEFQTNGTWTYNATMAGRYAGTHMKGSGTWKLTGDVLEYSAGANTGRTAITVSDKVLTFSPDPVVMPDGKTPSPTKYERSQ